MYICVETSIVFAFGIPTSLICHSFCLECTPHQTMVYKYIETSTVSGFCIRTQSSFVGAFERCKYIVKPPMAGDQESGKPQTSLGKRQRHQSQRVHAPKIYSTFQNCCASVTTGIQAHAHPRWPHERRGSRQWPACMCVVSGQAMQYDAPCTLMRCILWWVRQR